ncbi:HVO_2922 family protein [Halobium salinum]|uniref:HVO_2922 family protein n=1 Tax=Halobium salinum TaxID=1364940 RepID=A0ABD5PCX8_9EURY|nr:HVO_2922 family protein [Halobium salinum]
MTTYEDELRVDVAPGIGLAVAYELDPKTNRTRVRTRIERRNGATDAVGSEERSPDEQGDTVAADSREEGTPAEGREEGVPAADHSGASDGPATPDAPGNPTDFDGHGSANNGSDDDAGDGRTGETPPAAEDDPAAPDAARSVEVDQTGDEPVAVGLDAGRSQATFELFRDAADEWRWRLRHRNGNVVASSGEGYSSKANARKGLRSVKRNAPAAPVEEVAGAGDRDAD